MNAFFEPKAFHHARLSFNMQHGAMTASNLKICDIVNKNRFKMWKILGFLNLQEKNSLLGQKISPKKGLLLNEMICKSICQHFEAKQKTLSLFLKKV